MFQDNLKRIRMESGQSQEDLAHQLHVTRQTISKWERGLSQPDVDMLSQLSTLLHTPVPDLLKEHNEDNKYVKQQKEVSPLLIVLIVLLSCVLLFFILNILFAVTSYHNTTQTTTQEVVQIK